MATMFDIVTRAFRKTGVLGSGDTLEAEEIAAGVDTLNAMMHAWKLAGVDTVHTTLAFSADFPLGPEYEEGTVYLLASRLSPDYMVPASFDADDWFRKFQAAYTVIPTVVIPTGLRRMPSQYANPKRSRST